MKSLKQILILVITTTFLGNGSAVAMMKLDFTGPLQDIQGQIQKYSEQGEQKYNETMEKGLEKVKKASGFEGNALFKKAMGTIGKSVMGTAAGALKNGKFDTNSFKESLVGNLNKDLLESGKITSWIQDYKDAKAREIAEKNRAIDEQIVELEAKLSVITDDDEIEELNNQLADLKAQKDANLKEQTARSNEIKAKQARGEQLAKNVAEAQKYLVDKNKQAELVQSALNFLTPNIGGKEEDNSTLYGAQIEKLFLKADEVESGENNTRIRKAREREYYEALQDLMNKSIETNIKTDELSKASTTMVDSSTGDADGVYGAMTMRIGGDIQLAKSAAQYTRLILAEIRFLVAKDMQDWSDKYHMKDYDGDVTTLDLDKYILKKKDITAQKAGDIIGIDKIKGKLGF